MSLLTPLGVGFLGAGPVTQAIHLPTLARMTDLFRVAHVVDIDSGVAESVAGRVGARHSTSMQALLADPDVDVVAICSPHQFHAEQVIAACRAGVRAVLCEKPFAMDGDEARQIAEVSAETAVPIVVGAMHTFDPGWVDLQAGWGAFPVDAHTIRSSIVLPPNARFEDFATEVITRPGFPSMDLSDPEVAGRLVHGGVMGLAIHDLPLVRAFVDDFSDLRVHAAHAVAPFGYQILLTAGGKSIQLHAAMTQTWRPGWVLEAWSDDVAARIEFTPSYVQAGSAVSTLTRAGVSTTYGPQAFNGYEGEWRRIADIVAGAAAPVPTTTLIDDLRFAVAIAEAAAAAARDSHPNAASQQEGAL